MSNTSKEINDPLVSLLARKNDLKNRLASSRLVDEVNSLEVQRQGLDLQYSHLGEAIRRTPEWAQIQKISSIISDGYSRQANLEFSGIGVGLLLGAITMAEEFAKAIQANQQFDIPKTFALTLGATLLCSVTGHFVGKGAREVYLTRQLSMLDSEK